MSQERRARLVYTAGQRTWEVDVPLMSDTIGAALTALAPAIQLLGRKIKADWDANERAALIADRAVRRKARK